MVSTMRDDVLSSLFDAHIPPESMEEEWDVAGLEMALHAEFQLRSPIADWLSQDQHADLVAIKQRLLDLARDQYQAKIDLAGVDVMRQFERAVLLQHFDQHWREHLAALDHLRQGIHLRGYAQKNPKQEYKREAFELFSDMLERIKRDVAQILMTVQVRGQEDVDAVEPETIAGIANHPAATDSLHPMQQDEENGNPYSPENLAAQGIRVGRNDPCPCGSGKKYKQCHGKLA